MHAIAILPASVRGGIQDAADVFFHLDVSLRDAVRKKEPHCRFTDVVSKYRWLTVKNAHLVFEFGYLFRLTSEALEVIIRLGQLSL